MICRIKDTRRATTIQLLYWSGFQGVCISFHWSSSFPFVFILTPEFFLNLNYFHIILTHFSFSLYSLPCAWFSSHSFGYNIVPTSILIDPNWFYLESPGFALSTPQVKQPPTSHLLLNPGRSCVSPLILCWVPELRL